MPTIQAIIYAILNSIFVAIPIGDWSSTGFIFQTFSLSDPAPQIRFLSFASVLAAYLFYLKHDLVSHVSSVLRIIIERKLPKMMDERMPLFVIAANIPIFLGFAYFPNLWPANLMGSWSGLVPGAMNEAPHSWLLVLGIQIGIGACLMGSDRFSKRTKRLLDWNYLDAILMGLIGILGWIPGVGVMSALLVGGFMRHHQRASIAKFAMFSVLPALIFQTLNAYWAYKSLGMAEHSSWINLILVTIISFLVAIAGISGMANVFGNRGPLGYVAARISLVAICLGWLKYTGAM